MMPSSYKTLDGRTSEFDLDAVVDIVNGWSKIKPGWQGFVIYLPERGRFIELASTVPDVRGNSDDEAIEVKSSYVETAYGLTAAQISELTRAPSQWKFIKNR